MPKIEVYSSFNCSYCERAKKFLNEKNLAFEEINVSLQPERLDEMLTRAEGCRTVPQIFINDTGIGGFDELYALNRDGKLEALLKDGA